MKTIIVNTVGGVSFTLTEEAAENFNNQLKNNTGFIDIKKEDGTQYLIAVNNIDHIIIK